MNLPKVNAPLMLLVARNPHTYPTYDGAPFRFCPWCGTHLVEGPSLTKLEASA